jgi:predicted thioredoxin/glutaredoxin
MEISIESWKKLVIHEVIEYKFEDWIKQIAFSTRTSGGAIPTMQWANGIVFSPANFPTTNAVMEEQLRGILHWSSVSFAVKEKFEHQIVRENATINLVDVSVNDIFKELAEKLKTRSKYKNQ